MERQVAVTTSLTAKPAKSVTQEWVHELSLMQQSVLLSAIRGCDGVARHHKSKALVKWYRRCVLLSAFDGRALLIRMIRAEGLLPAPYAACRPIYLQRNRSEFVLRELERLQFRFHCESRRASCSLSVQPDARD